MEKDPEKRRLELLAKKISKTITEEEREELRKLQNKITRYRAKAYWAEER